MENTASNEMELLPARDYDEEGGIDGVVRIYACRMCRQTLFCCDELELHQHGRQKFAHKQRKGRRVGGGPAGCQSIFLAEKPAWMNGPQVEGGNSDSSAPPSSGSSAIEIKIICPGIRCRARLGTLRWTGSQCSCGTWVTPAFQFPLSKLDIRSVLPKMSSLPQQGEGVGKEL